MIKYFGIPLSPNKLETSEGFLICRNVPIARTGTQEYLARELELDGDPERVVTVYRESEDVFDPAAIASFEGKPLTDLHPSDSVRPDNFSGIAKGHVQNVRQEGDQLVADLFVSDAVLISDIQNGIKKEISCGYNCDYEEYKNGFKQSKIRGNHVAVVPQGRAGHDVAIKDHAKKAERRNAMSKLTEGVLKAFGMAVKDADVEAEKELIQSAADILEKAQEGAPVEKTPEPAPAEEPKAEPAADEGEPNGLEAKIDKLIEMIGQLVAAKTADEEPKTEEQQIDEAISELEKKEEPAADEGEQASEVIADEECKDEGEAEAPAEAKDALTVLKTMRPIIAGIKDKAIKAQVTDALIKSVKTRNQQDFGAIFSAVKDSAQKSAAQSGKTDYEKICEASRKAYAARNPHAVKED